MRETLKKDQGITLLSLVITVIVLMILSGVTISIISGDNGIINKAGEAKIRSEVSELIEAANIEETKGEVFVLEGKYVDKLMYQGEGKFLYNPDIVSEMERDVFESMNIYSLIDLYVFSTYTNNEKTEATIDGFSEKGLEILNRGITKFAIPTKTSSGLEVTKISDNAFKDYGTIEEISFPNSLQTIGNYSFQNCIGLNSVDLSNTKLNLINYMAFGGCTSVTEVNAPATLLTMERYVFQNCSNLVTVTGLDNITLMNTGSFQNCTKLENISIGKITSIKPYCFQNCTSLKNIEIPETVTSITEGAFKFCTSLEKVIIPSSVTSIRFEVWANCSSIQEIRIPSSVVSMGGNCFMNSCTTDAMLYVPFTAEEGAPEGWNARWNRSNAHFIYSDGTEETDSSKKYL